MRNTRSTRHAPGNAPIRVISTGNEAVTLDTRFRVTRASAVSRKRAAVPLSAEISQGAETLVSSRAGRPAAA